MSTLPDLPALSVRQPWAWFIINSTKRHENRDWSLGYLQNQLSRLKRTDGRFLIHAASGMTQQEFRDACRFARTCGARFDSVGFLKMIKRQRGGIVGSARFVDWCAVSESPWFMGQIALVLDDVEPLPFVPCKGMLGFFRPKLTTS